MLQIAWRNLFRNRKRTIVTVISVTVAVGLVALMRFVQAGMYGDMLRNAMNTHTGFVQVTANGWVDRKEMERYLEIDAGSIEKVAATEDVTAVSGRVEGVALLSLGSGSKFVEIMAADFEKEKQITRIHNQPVRSGSFFSSQAKATTDEKSGAPVWPAVIGKGLARALDAKTGDEMSLVSSQYDGSVGALLCKLVAVIEPLDLRHNNSMVFLPLGAGRDLFGLYDDPEKNIVRYTNLAVGITGPTKADSVHGALAAVYPNPIVQDPALKKDSPAWLENYQPVAYNWQELVPDMVQFIEFDRISAEFTYAFLILVMAFGLLNTVQMSIHERTRELGIMLALGTKAGFLYRLIVLEAFFIFLPGILLGGGIAMYFGQYLDDNPIEITGDIGEAYREMGFDLAYTATIDGGELVTALLTITIPSFIFIMLAARRVLKLKPLEAIQSL